MRAADNSTGFKHVCLGNNVSKPFTASPRHNGNEVPGQLRRRRRRRRCRQRFLGPQGRRGARTGRTRARTYDGSGARGGGGGGAGRCAENATGFKFVSLNHNVQAVQASCGRAGAARTWACSRRRRRRHCRRRFLGPAAPPRSLAAPMTAAEAHAAAVEGLTLSDRQFDALSHVRSHCGGRPFKANQVRRAQKHLGSSRPRRRRRPSHASRAEESPRRSHRPRQSPHL